MAEARRLPKLVVDSDAEPLDVLRMVGTYQRYLEAIEERAVAAARATGKTWEEIATALGVRRQSAWRRFSGVPVAALKGWPEPPPEADVMEVVRGPSGPTFIVKSPRPRNAAG